MMKFLSVEKIIELNLLALNLIAVKKADQAKVLSKSKIAEIVESCKTLNGDVYDHAVFLLKQIVQKHAFASGNRRTAFLVMKYFLVLNKQKLRISDNPENARVMQGIRENYYSDNELKEWIKNGKIRNFQR
ncbi:MAG: type II toxin-antitoxin system death-on-curing family toxin [Candidatus Diapherotrites archaeon]|nr:type II toxin-antitoxin system death-on-curing family toxin [Candidatus Diapherotrites archaeon]